MIFQEGQTQVCKEKAEGERKKEESLHKGRGAMKWSLQVGAVCCKYG